MTQQDKEIKPKLFYTTTHISFIYIMKYFKSNAKSIMGYTKRSSLKLKHDSHYSVLYCLAFKTWSQSIPVIIGYLIAYNHGHWRINDISETHNISLAALSCIEVLGEDVGEESEDQNKTNQQNIIKVRKQK